MIWIIRILFFGVLGLIIYGSVLNNNQFSSGDQYIGLGVLIMTLVLMPLFLFHRSRKRKLSDYIIKFDKKDTKKTENQ